LANLDEILKRHAAITDADANNSDLSDLPTVVYLGYSIHGNESSGTGAAIALTYYLAANDTELMKTLDKTIILLDPSFNPDGLHRFRLG
jgi:murein tripeptide amidase MpaA